MRVFFLLPRLCLGDQRVGETLDAQAPVAQLSVICSILPQQIRVKHGTDATLCRHLDCFHRQNRPIPQFLASVAASTPSQGLLVVRPDTWRESVPTPDTCTLATIAVKNVRSLRVFDTSDNKNSDEPSCIEFPAGVRDI